MPRNRAASRRDRGHARRASAARRANEDPDGDDARPTTTTAARLTALANGRPATTRGDDRACAQEQDKENQVALRVERGSARRALAALRADEDTDDGDARPSNDGDVSATNRYSSAITVPPG